MPRFLQSRGAEVSVGILIAGGLGSLIAAFTFWDDGNRAVAALFFVLAALLGVIGAIAIRMTWKTSENEEHDQPPPPRQDVRQRGENLQTAQQSATHNKGVIVGRDYIVGGEKNEQDKPPRAPTQTFIYNRDRARGLEYPAGKLWWRLTGWMFYRSFSRGALRFQPYCIEHRKRCLYQSRYGYQHSFSEDLDPDGDISIFICPWPEHGSPIVIRDRLQSVRETVRSLLESEAEEGKWDQPTPEEVAYNGSRDE